MSEELNPDNKLSPQELAKHLRHPEGETGKAVGIQMNKGNKHICLNSYKILNAQDGERILEIGMGNGYFISDLFQMADNIKYIGLDFSPTMIEEAKNINQKLIDSGKVDFIESSIATLPFDDDSIDAIITTNTLYFWPKPSENIKELLRILKPGGRILIGYRSKSFMDKIELANYGFTKYEQKDVESLLSSSGCSYSETTTLDEPELKFDGEPMKMTGFYTVGIK
ncbi:MAG: class I SAM-dependent methyltransferase [Flavobacteriales bacterium]|nr:class I SAM-dependent methyltransferase [Flavobacteriales bacterium]